MAEIWNCNYYGIGAAPAGISGHHVEVCSRMHGGGRGLGEKQRIRGDEMMRFVDPWPLGMRFVSSR